MLCFIPPHRPAFGLGTILVSAFANARRSSASGIEAAFAEACGCPGAVWLPSARAGIGWALAVSLSANTRVLGPAFTCTSVHEAMIRSGGRPVMLDAAADSFLMDESALVPAHSGPHALVLCEVYGHTYDLANLARNAVATPCVRIIDMAMSVPQPALIGRLKANDFAVISFGAGKSMYAGWGGMGFAGCQALAEEVRRKRDAALSGTSAGLWLQRIAEISARTIGQHPLVYTAVKRMQGSRPAPGASEAPAEGFPAAWSDDQTTAGQWRLPSTRLDRGLALWNLKQADRLHELRLALARRYHRNLASAKGVARPSSADAALSHYTVRVPANLRAGVQRRLSEAGVNALTLWEFSRHLDRRLFSNAFRLSTEILNLPLSSWMSLDDVDHLSEVLMRSVSQEILASP